METRTIGYSQVVDDLKEGMKEGVLTVTEQEENNLEKETGVFLPGETIAEKLAAYEKRKWPVFETKK